MLFRGDEHLLAPAEGKRPWQFNAPGGAFKPGVEAMRIHLAHLFDPLIWNILFGSCLFPQLNHCLDCRMAFDQIHDAIIKLFLTKPGVTVTVSLDAHAGFPFPSTKFCRR